ncbi:hypothetical protein [Microbacterium panaciterrae]
MGTENSRRDRRSGTGDAHRDRARHRGDGDYRPPWILREFFGAPVWAMIALGVLIIGLAVLYFMQH